MSIRELRALEKEKQEKTNLAPRTLRSSTRGRELAGPESRPASIVLQNNDLRLLIQSFTVYEDKRCGLDDVVDGGWKLAHLCKLNFTPRLALIGDMRKWTVDEMNRYFYVRMDYIICYRHPAPAASFKERQKFTCDVPQLVVQLKKWLKYHRETIQLADDDVFYDHLNGVLKKANQLLDLIENRKVAQAAAKTLRASTDELWKLRAIVQTNVLEVKCKKAEKKYHFLLNETASWLRKLIEEDYTDDAKNVLRVLLERLDTMDPLDGLTIQHRGQIRANTTCYRGAIWKYNDKRDKISQIRAGAELLVSAHGMPNLITHELVVNGEVFVVQLPEDAFEDEDDDMEEEEDVPLHAPAPQPAQQQQQQPAQGYFFWFGEDNPMNEAD